MQPECHIHGLKNNTQYKQSRKFWNQKNILKPQLNVPTAQQNLNVETSRDKSRQVESL